MTETIKTAKTAAGGAVRKPASAPRVRRDAYDDFLDAAERAERVRRPERKPVAGAEGGAAVKKAAAKRPSADRKPASGAEGGAAVKKAAAKRLSADRKPAAGAEGGAAVKKAAAKRPSADRKPAAETGTRDGVQKAAKRKSPAEPTAKKTSLASAEKAAAKKKSAAKQTKNDAYDEFLKEAEHSRPKKKKTGKKKRAKLLATALALLVMIGCLLGLAGWQYRQYQNFLVMKAAVDRATFYEGTFVEGVDVSGMTLEQAAEHWNTAIEPEYSQRRVALNNGASFTAAELGYSSDYMTVLNNAWNAGRSGSLVERYEALSQRRDQTANYNVTRTPYRKDVIESCVSAIAAQIDRPAVNAKIESFDTEKYTFVFSEEAAGSRLDAGKLAADMAQALDNGGGTVELAVSAIEPEVLREDIAGQYGMITSAVTNASSSNKNRLANIRLALEYINGVHLEPGETFSFNGTVGERTKDRGFKVATAYSSGTVIEEVGGGICQVSTTLFNAAVKADLEIVERHNHSLTVSYVDRGKDAAVNWGSQDLRFTNTSDDDVYIVCYLDGDKRVRFGIFGKLLPDGETITVETKTTEKIDYETELVPNLTLGSGQTKVSQKGKQGYKAEAYKVRWDEDGERISKELLCRSSYKSVTEIIEYGP